VNAAIREMQEGMERHGYIAEHSIATAVYLAKEMRKPSFRDLTLPGDLKKIFSQVVRARQEGLAVLEKARGETAALRKPCQFGADGSTQSAAAAIATAPGARAAAWPHGRARDAERGGSSSCTAGLITRCRRRTRRHDGVAVVPWWV
jgi:hypothetical protein